MAVYLSFCSLEVILKDASNPSEPIEVARKYLPYSFDVNSSRKVKRPSPAATPSAQPVAGLQEGDEGQIRGAGGLPDHERAGQRTNAHVSPMNEPSQQGASDLQRSLFASSAPHPSAVPRPPLLVQPQHHEEERDQLEGGQDFVWPMHSSFSLSASGFDIPGQSYDTYLGQHDPPLLRTNAHVSPMSEPNQQGASDLQRWLFASPAPHPSAVPKPPLLVQPQHGEEERGRPEGGQDLVWPMHFSSTPSASGYGSQHFLGQSYVIHDPPVFPHAPNLSFEWSNIATSADARIRGERADRKFQIGTLEEHIMLSRVAFEAAERERDAALTDFINDRYLAMYQEIADRWSELIAESQSAKASLNAEVAKHEAEIHILRQQIDQDKSIMQPRMIGVRQG